MTTAPARHATLGLRRGPRVHPIQTVVAIAGRNPRLAGFLGGAALIGFGATVLLVISSIQAFLVVSGQSSIMTDRRAALFASGADVLVGAAGTPAAAATAGSTALAGRGAAAGQPTEPVGPDEVVSVQGIRVHTSIAGELRALLSAAAADGITLSGWGWRDNRTQIRLRREHCGTTDYAIYRMPSSQCRPPTARPGSSQHERGLAIDFTYNGGSIGTRNSPGFRWLDANAGAYGFRNLASEPWHWSTTGR
jgi:hypothetical protein